MRARAEAFLARFPQSAFLAQAYEVAARASFDLQSYQPGLNYAEKSLALLPENPLLLVAVADVEAREDRNLAAIVMRRRRSTISIVSDLRHRSRRRDWPDVQRKLRRQPTFPKDAPCCSRHFPCLREKNALRC